MLGTFDEFIGIDPLKNLLGRAGDSLDSSPDQLHQQAKDIEPSSKETVTNSLG